MNDKDTVVVPGQREFVSKLSAALLTAYKANGGIAAIARRAHGAALIRNIATLEAAKVFADLAAAPSTSVREEELAALRECAKPYFWDADGFWPDASTPAHKQAEMERRQRLARAALKPSTDKEMP